MATDPTTNRTSKREVTDVIVGHGEKELVGVTVATAAGPAQIVATDGHPFWVDDQGEWLDAGDLGKGDELETAEHGRATVVATRTWKQVRTVYNLTVDGVHTYYVVAGDAPVLVHNCGGSSWTPDENYSPAAIAERSGQWSQLFRDRNASAARVAVRRGNGPPGVSRIDAPNTNITGSQWHAQGPGKGSPGVNIDGTPKDSPSLPDWPRQTWDWLRGYGWDVE